MKDNLFFCMFCFLLLDTFFHDKSNNRNLWILKSIFLHLPWVTRMLFDGKVDEVAIHFSFYLIILLWQTVKFKGKKEK